MSYRSSYRESEDDFDSPIPGFCEHGYRDGRDCLACNETEDYIDSRGGIDKCMNCGKYMYNDKMTRDQVCKIPCHNPNEY